MTDEDIKIAAQIRGRELGTEFTILCVPKEIASETFFNAARSGVGFDVLDDGEDSPVTVWVARLDSKAMDVHIKMQKKVSAAAMYAFLMMAFSTTLFVVTDLLPAALVTGMVMALAAFSWYRDHGRWDRLVRAQMNMKEHGL